MRPSRRRTRESVLRTLECLWRLGETGTLDHGVIPRRIAKDVDVKESTVRQHLYELYSEGKVDRATEFDPDRLGAHPTGYYPISD